MSEDVPARGKGDAGRAGRAMDSQRTCDPPPRVPRPSVRHPSGQPRARPHPENGGLAVSHLTLGFLLDGKPNAVFNTRIGSVPKQLRLVRRVVWTKAIAESRCLVPVCAFYERHMTGRVESKRIGRPVHRQYLFRLPSVKSFPLASVRDGDRHSVVTTRPNASVAPIHDRMPLVLGPGESSAWLGPEFATLSNRSRINLTVEKDSH